jgi:hypothetical protein
MTLKNAALLALIGTILMTALLVWTFVFNFLNVLRGLVPAAMLFSSLIYAFGCFSVAVIFMCSTGRSSCNFCLLLAPQDSPATPNTAVAVGHCELRCPAPSSARSGRPASCPA